MNLYCTYGCLYKYSFFRVVNNTCFVHAVKKTCTLCSELFTAKTQGKKVTYQTRTTTTATGTGLMVLML